MRKTIFENFTECNANVAFTVVTLLPIIYKNRDIFFMLINTNRGSTR